MITTPFRLFDCDAPVDGSTAVIVSAAEHAAERRPPGRPGRGGGHARCAAARRGTSSTTRPRWPPATPAPTSGTRTDLKPADVDVAELYDGFSFLTMTWLEALGFCGKGESGPFIEGGHRIARDGELPAQHPRRPAVGRPAPRLRLHPRGRASSSAARPATARCPARTSRWRRSANGGGPIAGALLLTEARLMAVRPRRRCSPASTLTEVEPGVVEGQNLDIGYHRVFGGQILAQVLAAAAAGVARQVGEVAPHPVPARGRHRQADALPGDEAPGRPHLRHHRGRRRRRTAR